MNARWIIIDGYSLLHHDAKFAAAGPRGMAAAREKLIGRLGSAGAALAERITVVFDGAGYIGQRGPQAPSPIEVVFSSSAETADSIIERLAHTASRPDEVLVVTSDRAERETVEAAGVPTMNCTDFLIQLDAAEKALHRTSASFKRSVPRPTLGDFFPPSAKK
jgi:predicted RNA-binding protein with PIN domain